MIKDRIWTLFSRKISGEATTSELVELSDLIVAQPDMHLYLQAIEEFWKIPPEKDEEFLEATYHLHLNRLKKKGFDLETDKDKDENHSLFFEDTKPFSKKRSNKKAYLGVTLVVVVAFVFFILYSNSGSRDTFQNNKIAQSEVSTKSGSRTRIQLPDGSSVWLNGNSKLVYDDKHFGEKLRQVTLSGEAYFDVVKNADKPFIIYTSKMEIKVLGTAFNVKAYPGEKNTETSLIRGSIEITLAGRHEKIMMKPNDKLIVSNAMPEPQKIPAGKKEILAANDNLIASMGHLTIAADDISVIETAWVENKLMFDNEAFEEVALKMERWYGVSIHFTNPDLKSVHLTGTFEKETIREALNALQISTPIFKYKIINNDITILK